MKIKTGLKIVIAASLATISIAMATSIIAGKYVREMAREEKSFSRILENINGLRALTYDFLMYRTDRARNQWLLAHNDIARFLAAPHLGTSVHDEAFDDFKARHSRVRDIFQHLLQTHGQEASRPELEPVLKETENRLTGQLLFETQNMVSDIVQLSSALSQRAHDTLRLADLINMGSWVLVLTIIIINSLYIFHSVVKPLFRVHKGVGIVAAGDLDHTVGIDIQNEVGELSRSFDQMTANLRRYTLQLERSNRELEDFAFVTSHDLQEPLRKIQTFADRLKTMYCGSAGDKERDYLDRIERSAGRMRDLIFALSRYSGIKSGIESMEPIDLKGPVERAIADLEPLRESTEGIIEVGELPRIEADQAQMRDLFRNLIDNGLRYHCNHEPFVQVYSDCACSDGCFEIHVIDNGIGFRGSYLDQIFKPFQRLHGKDSPYQGTGIGLTICRRIVELHGGTITAQSEPDKGSTFTVRLPRAQKKTEAI